MVPGGEQPVHLNAVDAGTALRAENAGCCRHVASRCGMIAREHRHGDARVAALRDCLHDAFPDRIFQTDDTDQRQARV